MFTYCNYNHMFLFFYTHTDCDIIFIRDFSHDEFIFKVHMQDMWIHFSDVTQVSDHVVLKISLRAWQCVNATSNVFCFFSPRTWSHVTHIMSCESLWSSWGLFYTWCVSETHLSARGRCGARALNRVFDTGTILPVLHLLFR